MSRTTGRQIFCVTAALAASLSGRYTLAQQAAQSLTRENTELQEVVVTARKQQESILDVPVVETAIQQAQLQNLQIIDIGDLPSVVPGLIIGHEVSTIGDLISIRGVGSISFDAGVDSSVLLNIDGLSLANNIAFESGMFDQQQIEVLKGPQSLYFGKSATGGVISLRTADPTDKFEVIARTSYEAESVTPREEAIVSGPVTDTLKLRLASMYSTSQGYFKDHATPIEATGALAPTQSRAPDSEDYIIRGTVLWDPTSQLSVRFKANVVHDYLTNGENFELTSCPQGAGFAPSGIPFLSGAPCQLGRDEHLVYMNPANFPGIINNGVPFADNNQHYGTLELNYLPTDQLTLTSVTAAYWLHQDSMINATFSGAAAPAIISQNVLSRREATEELRLNSNFDSPLNFMVGGYFENGQIYYATGILGNSAYQFPDVLSHGEETADIKTYSAFGQARWKIMPRLELAAGVRWTRETRTETVENLQTDAAAPVAVPRLVSSHAPPEFSLTWRPTDDLTAYAAVKQAYKSGSFILGGYPPPAINAYGDEKAAGGELGLKSFLLSRSLSLNVTGYYYRFTGLQVGAVAPGASSVLVDTTQNAGAARTFGVDLDGAYRPPGIAGLGFTGGAAWNDASYITLNNVPCYGGQTIAAGCNQLLNASTGLYAAQNLSGTAMVRAPKWQVNGGITYEYPFANSYKMVVANNNSFTARYVTFLAATRPNNDQYQGSFFKTDLSVMLQAPDDRWELALIGRNLTDRITAGVCAASNFANGAVFPGQVSGGAAPGSAGIDQVGCWAEPGREAWVRLTVHLQ